MEFAAIAVACLAQAFSQPMSPPSRRDVAAVLAEIGAVRFGNFRLKDGRESPFYVDLRGIIGFPRSLRKVGEWLADAAQALNYDCIAAIPYAGIPLGVAMALAADRPLVYPRKEPKAYGTERLVEGRFSPGQCALVVDDVLTSGTAKLEALMPLRQAGLIVRNVLVVVDRQERGASVLQHEGISVHHLITIRQLLDELRTMDLVTALDYERACRFIERP
ncbi:MAG: orotate phosphoribosyltransferase [Candidatus Binatia bacterium]|nr:MAG: orotate phosphoribosyltransferase [Candidatus Binatia bacterium]